MMHHKQSTIVQSTKKPLKLTASQGTYHGQVHIQFDQWQNLHGYNTEVNYEINHRAMNQKKTPRSLEQTRLGQNLLKTQYSIFYQHRCCNKLIDLIEKKNKKLRTNLITETSLFCKLELSTVQSDVSPITPAFTFCKKYPQFVQLIENS